MVLNWCDSVQAGTSLLGGNRVCQFPSWYHKLEPSSACWVSLQGTKVSTESTTGWVDYTAKMHFAAQWWRREVWRPGCQQPCLHLISLSLVCRCLYSPKVFTWFPTGLIMSRSLPSEDILGYSLTTWPHLAVVNIATIWSLGFDKGTMIPQ